MSQDSTPRRALVGVRRPGERVRMYTGAGEIPPSATHRPDDPTTQGDTAMSAPQPTQVIDTSTRPLFGFNGYATPAIANLGDAATPAVRPMVTCQGPASVAAEAARQWADVIDPPAAMTTTPQFRTSWAMWLRSFPLFSMFR